MVPVPIGVGAGGPQHRPVGVDVVRRGRQHVQGAHVLAKHHVPEAEAVDLGDPVQDWTGQYSLAAL